MDQVVSFIIHISTSFLVYTIRSDHWPVVTDIGPESLRICICSFLTIQAFNKQCFRIISKTLMHPHISYVPGSNIIAEPFMTAFMYDDIIPVLSPAAA